MMRTIIEMMHYFPSLLKMCSVSLYSKMLSGYIYIYPYLPRTILNFEYFEVGLNKTKITRTQAETVLHT